MYVHVWCLQTIIDIQCTLFMWQWTELIPNIHNSKTIYVFPQLFPAQTLQLTQPISLLHNLSTRCVRNGLVAISLWTNYNIAVISWSYHKLVVVTLVATFYVISDLLRQLNCNKSMKLSTFVTRCFQICQTITADTPCERILISAWWTDLLQFTCKSVTACAFL